MGQKVNPTGYRTGVFLGWKSRWYASKREFSEILVEDFRIRQFIKTRKNKAGRAMYPMISKIEIERTRDEVKVILFSARPGQLIGQKGERVEELQNDLQNLVGRRINIVIEEIKRPELNAQLVAEDIGEQLVKRASFRKAMKKAMELTMKEKDGAKGIKIQLSGRLGGADMARCEKAIEGSIPLSTLRSNIDYGFCEAKIAQGHIGIQVWINLGAFNEETNDGKHAQESTASKGTKKTFKR